MYFFARNTIHSGDFTVLKEYVIGNNIFFFHRINNFVLIFERKYTKYQNIKYKYYIKNLV